MAKKTEDLKEQAKKILIEAGVDATYQMSTKDLVAHLQTLNVDKKDESIQSLISKLKSVSK